MLGRELSALPNRKNTNVNIMLYGTQRLDMEEY